jgi:hypothetical protein
VDVTVSLAEKCLALQYDYDEGMESTFLWIYDIATEIGHEFLAKNAAKAVFHKSQVNIQEYSINNFITSYFRLWLTLRG